jgi:hypothetical protein
MDSIDSIDRIDGVTTRRSHLWIDGTRHSFYLAVYIKNMNRKKCTISGKLFLTAKTVSTFAEIHTK